MARSLALLRKRGCLVSVVEQTVRLGAFTFKRDLFNVFDIVAIQDETKPRQPYALLGVQTTSASNLSSRVKKVLASPITVPWLRAPMGIEVHGWKRAKERWVCRIVDVTLDGDDVVTHERMATA